MKILSEKRISDTITLAEVDKFPEELYLKQVTEWLLAEHPFLRWQEALSDDEKSKLQKLHENLSKAFKLRIGIFDRGEMKGWTFGWQESSVSFHMGGSAIVPELRRKGLYSELVSYVLSKTKDLGFQSISSTHLLTNNSVIIAKLKMGFTVKGVEVDAIHGTLLRLNYHHNDLMKAAAEFRAGNIDQPRVLKYMRPGP